MSWDERLFRIGYNAVKSILRRKYEHPHEDRAKVLLTDVSDRLALIAGILTGEKIEIREAETVGGFVDNIIFLPARFAISNDSQINWQAYLFRLLYSLCQRQLGFAAPINEPLDLQRQLLLSVLAVPKVDRKMDDLLPAIKTIRSCVCTAALEKRPKLNIIENDSDVLEALFQIRLGTAWQDIESHATEKSRMWIKLALQSDVNSREDLFIAADGMLKNLQLLPKSRRQGPKPESLWGLVMNERPINPENLTGARTKVPAAGLASGTEKKAKPKEKVEEVKLSESPLGDNPIVHSFEKLHTADEYKGGQKSRDAEDSLDEHAEALEELDLRKIVRTYDRAQSVYKADVMMDFAVGDLAESAPSIAEFLYDEWDERGRTYKKNWCSVFVEHNRSSVDEKNSRTYVEQALKKNHLQICRLKQVFKRLQLVRRWQTRQPDGPEIDLDAVIDRYVTLKSGHSPSSKLYLLRRRQERDIATLILLDASLSTDSWVQNRRVLDVAKESIIVLGDVAADLRDKIAIGAFYSNTRRDCRYIEIKRYNESWQSSQKKLVGLHPAGYTRIGPALRHSIYLLSKIRAKKKLLLLISDGKPTDFDRYEGRYGIGDIRQAIREGYQKKIHIKALAIDTQAKFYLPQMFGPGNYTILPRPDLLTESLAEIYGQLLR